MSVGRWLLDAGKELIAVIVELIAESPKVPPPKVHPRHRVVARPIGERARRADDEHATPIDNPRAKPPREPRGH